LDVEDVLTYLGERRVCVPDSPIDLRRLSGGVSSNVFSVRWRDQGVIVKQALPRLLVEDEWYADPSRALSEGAAISLAHALLPGWTPEVLDIDAERLIITITHAPDGWKNWKEELLVGRVEQAVAAGLGSFLGQWHCATSELELDPLFAAREPFESLRVDPFYWTIARRHPDLAPDITDTVERMNSTRSCLVHGDFSPKNVLSGDGQLWVLDFEVTHMGDPTFDVAFLLHHLLLKAIHRPKDAESLLACGAAFLQAYRDTTGGDAVCDTDPTYLFRHVGCLALARVDGKSPVDYLTHDAASNARFVARSLIASPPDTLAKVWSRIAPAKSSLRSSRAIGQQ